MLTMFILHSYCSKRWAHIAVLFLGYMLVIKLTQWGAAFMFRQSVPIKPVHGSLPYIHKKNLFNILLDINGFIAPLRPEITFFKPNPRLLDLT